jgi:hypothetical protein
MLTSKGFIYLSNIIFQKDEQLIQQAVNDPLHGGLAGDFAQPDRCLQYLASTHICPTTPDSLE